MPRTVNGTGQARFDGTRFLDGDGAMGMGMGMSVAVDAAPIRPISAMMMSRARRQSSRHGVEW